MDPGKFNKTVTVEMLKEREKRITAMSPYITTRNVLKRRRECGTYLATACRHRRRLKMQKRDE